MRQINGKRLLLAMALRNLKEEVWIIPLGTRVGWGRYGYGGPRVEARERSLYVDASCIRLLKDSVANTSGFSERNFPARLLNRSMTRPNALREQLYGINNEPIANFSRTSGHLGRLRGMYLNSRQT